jgi:hypothetical protein
MDGCEGSDRSRAADRAKAMVELNALEKSMRRLLSMVEARSTDLDGLARATEEYESKRVDAVMLVERFRGAGKSEIGFLRRRLMKLADLDAVLRVTCSGEMATTAAAIGRVRAVRGQLESMSGVEGSGEAVDCVR